MNEAIKRIVDTDLKFIDTDSMQIQFISFGKKSPLFRITKTELEKIKGILYNSPEFNKEVEKWEPK